MGGAAYLVWIGVKLLLSKAPQVRPDLMALAAAEKPRSLMAIWRGGFWTNVLNPKVAIFFLAFVPQFIAPDAGNKALAFVLLGVLFNLNAIPVNSGWAACRGLDGQARQRAARHALAGPRGRRHVHRLWHQAGLIRQSRAE